jgi:hypothetical protein
MILELGPYQMVPVDGLIGWGTYQSHVLLTIEMVRYVDVQVSARSRQWHIGFVQWLNDLVDWWSLLLVVPCTIEWIPFLLSMSVYWNSTVYFLFN